MTQILGAHPYTWPNNALPINFRTLHLEQSPTTPYAIVEFQGGSFDPWGGPGFAQCETLLNQEFERVFFKNDYSFGVTILNFYMVRETQNPVERSLELTTVGLRRHKLGKSRT